MSTVPEILLDRLKKSVLEKERLPWQKPWNVEIGMPQNLVSKKAYSGMNILMLAFTDFSSPYWLTWNQAEKLGGYIKAGQEKKYEIVTFWKSNKYVKKTFDSNGEVLEEEKKGMILRYYKVWNAEQTEDVKFPEIEQVQHNPIPEAESVVNGMPNQPEILLNGTRAFYVPSKDKVVVPAMGHFGNVEEYYSTLFHELTHSTSHKSRLDRWTKGHTFGDKDYSKEELVAEIGAALLCGYCGMEVPFDNSVAYLQSWLSQLENDPKMLVRAAGQAQKAMDYILHIEKEVE